MRGYAFGADMKEKRQKRKAAALLSSWNQSSYDKYLAEQKADMTGERIGTNLLEELQLNDLSDELKTDWLTRARSWSMSGRTKDQVRQGMIDLAPQYRELNKTSIIDNKDAETATTTAADINVDATPVGGGIMGNTVEEFSKLMDIETSPGLPMIDRLNAISVDGAVGISQVLPETGMKPGFKLSSIFDLADNEECHTRGKTSEEATRLLKNEMLNKQFGFNYYSMLKDRYNGNVEKSLIGYNARPDVADKWNGDYNSLPEETQNYLRKFGIDIDAPSSSSTSLNSQMASLFSLNNTGRDNSDGQSFKDFISNPWQAMKDAEAAEVELIVLNKLALEVWMSLENIKVLMFQSE